MQDYYNSEGLTVYDILEKHGIYKDFYLGNIIKYVKRAGLKDSYDTAYNKAFDYLKRLVICTYGEFSHTFFDMFLKSDEFLLVKDSLDELKSGGKFCEFIEHCRKKI